MVKPVIFAICLGVLLSKALSIPLRSFADIELIGSQKSLFPFLGGSAPYFSFPANYGIPTDIPEGCRLTQVQMIGRHGERYPTRSEAKDIFEVWYKISNYTGKYEGSLSFLNSGYEFFIPDESLLEMETTLQNSIDVLNPYTGEMNAKRHAREFLAKYGKLMENCTNFPIFTTNSKRIYDTAQYFAEALGDGFNISLQTLSENSSSGANTLAAKSSCPNWNSNANNDILMSYSRDYLENISDRLNDENKGLNLSRKDAAALFSWCAFELNAKGYSNICDIFSAAELIHYSYETDLTSFYQNGPGYKLIKSIGANLFNATVKLIRQSAHLDQKVWLSFTHDTDILNYLTTAGLIDDTRNLTTNHVPFRDHSYHRSWYIPQGARVYTEKFQCSNDSYVRYVVNDAVVPIESCSSGPGFSCEEGTFYEYAKDRLRGVSFYEDCDVSKVSKEKELTFYWDWNTTRYNASLVNQ
ncbi:CIH_HP2_G0008240.mRNA.1.CDS.1 [Saccharomyces cerevisiae]|nr:BTE_HP_G0075040.mRNA.1.CDS.1 [Saccharomyces cerevisiae]CAI5243400.1 CIH_HP2_G0008240.mRNA.1.CDS.1 [Saccharomyces cerevisiae]CAI6420565.1 CIH_HP2_G0008240.mRNA.1.CDS.1 [Saccharomyces cerevisiae]CAI6421533.1 CIH_HP1_G0008300.mRNA.1.CDS.1 [Saccharomyces cerevisiae]CAI6936483.1 BTE_HP_G0075040.mRNA.1.CDS.1 [Saccharomyces cerevisiae]